MDVGLDKDGKRKKKGVGGFKLKKDAEEAAAKMLLEVTNGTYTEEKDISFREFSKLWLKDYSSTIRKSGSTVKKATIRLRESEIERLLKYFDQIPVKDITKNQFQDALQDLLDQNYSNSVLSGFHCTGKMIFKKAIEWDVIKKNPIEYVRIPHKQEELEEEEEEIPNFLEKEELHKFLETAKLAGIGDDYAIFLTLSYTGIRVGELCALRKINIDIPECVLKIRRTYYNHTNRVKEYELVLPKTLSSRRDIKASKKVFNEIGKILTRQEITKAKSDKWHDKGFIFCSEGYNGYPITVPRIEYRMKRLLKIAGLNSSLTPHSLRHTHTSLLAEAGVSLEAIMDRLGHSDDDTTKKIYLHVTKAVKIEVASKFDQLMDSL